MKIAGLEKRESVEDCWKDSADERLQSEIMNLEKFSRLLHVPLFTLLHSFSQNKDTHIILITPTWTTFFIHIYTHWCSWLYCTQASKRLSKALIKVTLFCQILWRQIKADLLSEVDKCAHSALGTREDLFLFILKCVRMCPLLLRITTKRSNI